MQNSLNNASNLNQLNNLLNSVNTGIQQNLVQHSNNSIDNMIADFISNIQNNIDSKNMTVSGAMKNIIVQKVNNNIQVVGNDYLAYQNYRSEWSKTPIISNAF